MALRRPKGTQDHLPDGSPKLDPATSARWQRFVTDTAGRILERAGAQFIATPIFEEAELVKRGVGGSTDIVRKEMFTVSYQTNVHEQFTELKLMAEDLTGPDGVRYNLENMRSYIKGYKDYRTSTYNQLSAGQNIEFGIDDDTVNKIRDSLVDLIGIENEVFLLQFALDAIENIENTRLTSSFVLRPEGTAGIVRAYLENGLKQLPAPLKLWTHGPMFRAENVQKGRLRQFHQVDYEVLGSDDPLVDAEAIWLMVEVVKALGLGGVQVKLGSIGDPEDRDRYNAYLRETFSAEVERLSSDSQDRLERNPMRILDSKDEGDQRLIAELAVRPMLDFLGPAAQANFDAVRKYLDAWDVGYQIDPGIVRGLDYYRRTAWELHHAHIGAKSALGGGGRYDGLSAQLGGPEVPGIGWAFGTERLLLAMHDEGVLIPEASGPLLYVAALDEANVGFAATVALGARQVGRAEFAYRALKPGAAFKDGERRGARFVALIGSDEVAADTVTVKELASGAQRTLPLRDLDLYLTGQA